MSSVKIEGNASGTGIFTIASPNSNTNRTLTLPDNTGTIVTTGSSTAITQSMIGTGVAGTGPAFSAYQSSAQSISNSTNTKVDLQTEDYDTASCFSSSRFTPNVSGYYQINGASMIAVGASGAVTVQLYKNGSLIKFGSRGVSDGNNAWGVVSSLVYFNGTTDYIELYVFQDSGGSKNMVASAPYTWMNGFLARAA